MPTQNPTTQINVIPADSPSIFEALQTLRTSNSQAYNAIVRPNNPPAGIGGFLFDIPGDEEVRLKSSITRYFVEDNTPISDHIALEPETVTVRGLVAELVSGVPQQATQQPTPNVLPILPIMSPPPTPAQAQEQVASAKAQSQTTQALAGQQSLWQYFLATAPNVSSQTRQAQAALYFQQAWWGRQIFSVETPWGIWTNMAIAEVRMQQGKESKGKSDFSIIFERIRVAGDLTIQAGNLAGRNAINQAPTTQNGQAGAAPLPIPVPSFVPAA